MTEVGASTGERDRTTIGTSSAGEEALAVLFERKWFDSDVAAFRVAVTYAVANDLSRAEEGSYKTKWNVGSVDPDGRLRDLVQYFVPSNRPYDTIQRLGDVGLSALADGARNGRSLTSMIVDKL